MKLAQRLLLGTALAFGATAVFGTAMPASAQGQPAAQAFSIPAQPLQAALESFSRSAGWQVGYPPGLVLGKTSAAVSGTLSPTEALSRLLAGSGLTYQVTGPNAAILAEAPAAQTGGAVMLDALTVTGEKIERSVQDTATSVAVFDDKALQQRPGLQSSSELLARVPNVVSVDGDNFAPTIRGIDGTGANEGVYAFIAGIRPRVNLMVDGRPTSFNELVFGNNTLWDVEQVEVLRGPQSTMQGRSAIGGAIVMKTKDPTWDWQGGGRLLGGSYDTRQGAAYVSGPLIEEQLAFRLAADRQTRDSYLNGIQGYAGMANPGDSESTMLRGKLLIEPRQYDGFSTLLTLNYNKVQQPQVEATNWPEAGLQTQYPTNTSVFKPRTLSGIADTTLIINDALTLENTFSYTDLAVRRYAPPGQGYVEIDGYELLEEPRLKFTAMDGRLSGVGGLHAFHASQDELFNFSGNTDFRDLTTTYATFGEATYEVVPNIDLSAGGRLERETRRRRSVGTYPVDFDETYDVFLPKFGAAWHATPDWTFGTMVSRGYNGGGGGFSFGSPNVSYTFKPEYVWNYEAYTRARLLGGRLELTGNIFYADYKDIQLPFQLGPQSSVIRNADAAVTYGSEIGARYLAAKGLSLFGSIGLLRTEVTEYAGSGIEGNELPKSPAFTADAGFTYELDSGFDLGADLRYSEAYFSDAVNTPRAKVDPYWVANAQAGYRFGSARVFSFVNNVFDNRDEVSISAFGGANILRPRTIGVGLDVTF